MTAMTQRKALSSEAAIKRLRLDPTYWWLGLPEDYTKEECNGNRNVER